MSTTGCAPIAADNPCPVMSPNITCKPPAGVRALSSKSPLNMPNGDIQLRNTFSSLIPLRIILAKTAWPIRIS